MVVIQNEDKLRYLGKRLLNAIYLFIYFQKENRIEIWYMITYFIFPTRYSIIVGYK